MRKSKKKSFFFFSNQDINIWDTQPSSSFQQRDPHKIHVITMFPFAGPASHPETEEDNTRNETDASDDKHEDKDAHRCGVFGEGAIHRSTNDYEDDADYDEKGCILTELEGTEGVIDEVCYSGVWCAVVFDSEVIPAKILELGKIKRL